MTISCLSCAYGTGADVLTERFFEKSSFDVARFLNKRRVSSQQEKSSGLAGGVGTQTANSSHGSFERANSFGTSLLKKPDGMG
jgi:hypothetical protein